MGAMGVQVEHSMRDVIGIPATFATLRSRVTSRARLCCQPVRRDMGIVEPNSLMGPLLGCTMEVYWLLSFMRPPRRYPYDRCTVTDCASMPLTRTDATTSASYVTST